MESIMTKNTIQTRKGLTRKDLMPKIRLSEIRTAICRLDTDLGIVSVSKVLSEYFLYPRMDVIQKSKF
jgi:hypothetical protein